jgi:hypothetical protein
LKRKLVALDLVLAALTAVLAFRVRDAWLEARKREQVALGRPLKQLPPPPYAPLEKPEAVQAAAYAAVAQEMLWSEDRNPAVVVVEAVTPMPDLPAMYGVFNLSGDGFTAIMAVKAGGPHEVVKEGQKIGEFKLAALTAEQVTLEWRDKKVTRKIEELVDRSEKAQSAAQGPAAPRPEPGAPAPAVVSSTGSKQGPGAELGQGMKACVPGDTTPAGTVQDGYRKVVRATPFGQMCNWVQVR